MIGFLFAGQGSQQVGMGAETARMAPAAGRVFELGSDLLGVDVLGLDADQLAQTRYAQPAILVCTLAEWAVRLEREGCPDDAAFAGFSLGEYAALAASGRLSLEDTVRLVELRARLMQDACEKQPGAMSAVLGLDAESIQRCLDVEGLSDTVIIANRNAPLQSVIAGPPADVEQAAALLQQAGARRVARLPVSGAFHTRYMAEAGEALRAAFADLALLPNGPGTVYSNVYASSLPEALAIESDPSLSAYLERHMTRPVRWVEEIRAVHENGAESFLEFGPGKVLTGLVGKILPDVPAMKAFT